MATQAGGKENLGELFGFVVDEDKALWHAPGSIGLGPTYSRAIAMAARNR